MRRPTNTARQLFWLLALPCMAAVWWGCAKGSGESTTTNTSLSGGGGTGGTDGTGGTGGGLVGSGGNGGNGGNGGGGVCSSTSAEAHRIPLDIIFLIDRSQSMSGTKWEGTTQALTEFFNDPQSADIGAGLILFPAATSDCNVTHYETLTVPIAPLPANAFPLTNALPADATVYGTPLYGALKGTLLSATAYQDAHPAHKVNVVLATDGDGNGCSGYDINSVAALAKSALDYNGVHTYAIGVEGSIVPNLDQIAASGGTTAAYDITQDISQFAAKIAEIRTAALGCDFSIPAPPHGKKIDPEKVNFSYTPGGIGNSQLLPRAQDLADCGGKPGWYFDDNTKPTEILLCPASCSTVENDQKAKVAVLFGCDSVIN